VATLRFNLPLSASRLVLPAIVPAFLSAYPDIRMEVVSEESSSTWSPPAVMPAYGMASGWNIRVEPCSRAVGASFWSGVLLLVVSKRRGPALLTFARESSSLMPYSPGGRGR
jgi:hypothetical protein